MFNILLTVFFEPKSLWFFKTIGLFMPFVYNGGII